MKIKGKQLEDTLRSESAPFDIVYADRTVGDLNGAVRFTALNNSGSTIGAYKVVYITGSNGNLPTIGLADADTASMPAFGLTTSSSNNGDEVDIITFGNIKGVDTSTLSVGDVLYVSTTAGEYTVTPPTGNTTKLQNIGMVVKSDSNGIIKVGGAGRSNATPNLDQGHFFLGNASNQSVQSAYELPLTVGTSGKVLTSDGTNVTFQDAAGGGGSDFVPLTSDIARTDFTASQYYTVFGETNQRSIYLANKYEGDDINGDFLGKRITVENRGTSTVRVLLRLSNTTNRLYDNEAGVATNTFNQNQVTISSVTYAYFDVPSLELYRVHVRETANTAVTHYVMESLNTATLSKIENVSISNLANNETIAYNSTSNQWENTALGMIAEAKSANFTAAANYFYLVATTSGNTITATLPTASAVGQRIKIFNHGDGILKLNDPGTGVAIDPFDSEIPATNESSRLVNSRALVELVSTSTSLWEYVIIPQLELDESTLTTTGQVFAYNSTELAMKALPYTFPSADGQQDQILSTSGNGVLSFVDQPSGGGGMTYSAISANTTAQVNYHYSCTGTITVTLPTASGTSGGEQIDVKNMGTGTITINRGGSDTIDGATSYTMTVQYEAVSFRSNGSNGYEIV